MKHIDFVVWMLLFPFLSCVANTIKYKYGEREEYDETVIGIASILEMCIWFGIGWALW